MHLPSIQKCIDHIPPGDSFNYAPASGKPELREAWRKKMLDDNPLLRDKNLSNPIATNGLTHALTLTADLFVDPGDTLILPDKLWGNYRLIFEVRLGGQFTTFPLYTEKQGFNTDGLKKALEETAQNTSKIITLLNFPNNPTGYSITPKEAEESINKKFLCCIPNDYQLAMGAINQGKPASKKIIHISKPFLGKDEFSAAIRILKSGKLKQGTETSLFESRFAEYVGASYSCATSSGSASLHIAFLSINKKASEVLVPSFTFLSTASMSIHAGLKPVLVDIDPQTFTIDLEDLKKTLLEPTINV